MWIAFVISLLVIILTHEVAHLIVAKLTGCEVEKFSIGFGKPIWSKKIKKTQYQIAPWLFGGYCQLKGELTLTKAKGAFSNLKYSKKFLIVVAGCLVNIILGLIALMFNYPQLKLFGNLSILMGISNLVPFPALDGSYIYLLLLEKIYGKKKGLELCSIICKIGFIVLMTLQVLCVPILIWSLMKGVHLG